MGDALDLPTLRRAMRIYAEALRTHREELDSLNVYPVPDGDTGTNMLLTQMAVVGALEASAGDGLPPEDERVTISRASLMGARGNSGVILSQILRGLVEAMPEDGSCGPGDVAEGLERAASEAYRAVARPVEGTVLSVIRDAAAVAIDVSGRPGASSSEVLTAALEGARASLARTREQLPELKRAGVVDAGGKGIVLLLDALVAATAGREPSEPVGPLGPLGPIGVADGGRTLPAIEFAYEVQFLLQASDDRIGPLRAALGDLGDSLVVVGGSGLFNVHVHTNEPDEAVEIGRRAGRPQEIRVASLRERVPECVAGQARAVQVAEQVCGMVAVAEGEGLARTFHSLGAAVVAGGPGNHPSVPDLLAAIDAAPGGSIFVLPNHRDVVPTAEQAVGGTSKQAVVLPTRSIPAGLAAATVFNPLRSFDENERAMKEGADGARGGELVQAHRDAETPAGSVRRGQWLGMVEGEIVAVAGAAADGAVALVEKLAGPDAEVVTLVVGTDAGEERGSVERALRRSFPRLAVEALDGGQPRLPFLIGVE